MWLSSTDARRPRWPLALLITLLAVLPYLNSLRGEFVFDDIDVIRDHQMVNGDAPALGLLTWVRDWYRPLTMLTYALNWRLSENPFGFHLVNVVLHAAVALTVFALLELVLASRVTAGIAAALFAVHPIHTEAVANIIGRAELLAALCVMLSLYAFVRAELAAPRSALAWRLTSLAMFACGLFAKESALTAIGLLAVTVWYRQRDMPARTWMRAARWRLTPYLAIALAYLAVRRLLLGALGMGVVPGLLDNPLAHVPTSVRILTAIVILSEYCSALLMPLDLAADYSFPAVSMVSSATDLRFVLAATTMAAGAFALLWHARRAPVLCWAGAFTAIPLTLTANLLFPIGTIKAERLLYLPSVGFCLALAILIEAGIRHRMRALATAVTAGLVVLLAGYGARTVIRNRDWHDQLGLFRATVTSVPESAKAHHNLAVALNDAGDLEAATLHYRRALALYPAYASAAFGIGQTYGARGIDGGLVYWCEEALRLDWHLMKAHLLLALLRSRHGEHTAAEAALRAGLEVEPEHPLLLVTLSATSLAQGDRWQAVDILQRLNRLRTSDVKLLQQVRAAQNEIEGAVL